ncbi:MAG: hypothetical protein ACE5Q6_23505 [Dehalococcoidia bacterium]
MSFRRTRAIMPALLVLLLVFLVACGTAASPVNNSGSSSSESMAESDTEAVPKESMTGESMSQESMSKADEAMTGESMAKAGEAMDKASMAMKEEGMAKEGEAMSSESMAKSGEAMDKESMTMKEEGMAKEGEAMAGESMTKSSESMGQETMEKMDKSMSEETMAKEGEAMDTDAMAKSDAMEKAGEAMAMSGGTLTLELSGLDPLANGFHYEGWAIVEGSPVSTGKFNVDAAGHLIDLSGQSIGEARFHGEYDLGSASAIVITIEPAGDVDDLPADTHYLAGSVSEGVAELTVGHAAALGDDFANASGTYILATPTDGPGTNENSGIWFLDPSRGSPAVGLDLPQLPAGWVYEGWVVLDGTPVSTGQFTAVDQVALTALFSGPLSGPPFPGEDFLVNAPEGISFPTDLAGAVAVISIEPIPDDSPKPFTLKPLVGNIPQDATDHFNYELENNSSGFPTGSATLK